MYSTCEIYLILTCTWMMHVHSQSTQCSKDSGDMICDENIDPSSLYSQYREYRLPRINPAKVGRQTKLRLKPGSLHIMTTRSKNPPIFEIPEFLSKTECDYLINTGKSAGMKNAEMLGEKGPYSRATGNVHTRKGEVAYIETGDDKQLRAMRQRIATLTRMPADLVADSENFQIGHYGVGGHYHSHYDSNRLGPQNIPCCHQTPTPHSMEKCTACRYITVMIYLNDVEKGGETAFPLADTTNVTRTEKHYNLSKYCYQAPVVLRPKQGTAVMWYNNFRDQKTGWLGSRDPNSLHGGCPVLKGEKWIANVWLSASKYEQRYDKSIFHNQ